MSGADPTLRPVHGTLVGLGTRPLTTAHGDFVVHVFQNLVTRDYALAVACGDLTTPAPLLARVHSSCVTSESYGSCDCDCAQQLDTALAHVARAGRGVVFYLMQEGRGAGFVAKARDRMIVQASGGRLTTFEAYEQMGLSPDPRHYGEIALACRLLGITAPFELLTNNPDKVTALEADGLRIARVRPLRHAASPFNVQYLRSKSRVGHTLGDAGGTAEAATLPARVTRFEPTALTRAPHLVHMASYLLPVVLRDEGESPGPHWFWLHAYLDVPAGRPRVVLTYGTPAGGRLLVRLQTETFLERLMKGGGAHRRHWNAMVRAFVRERAGCVVLVPRDDLSPPAAAHAAYADDTALTLLAHHAGTRRVCPVLGDAAELADESLLRAALVRHGLESDAALRLDGGA